MAVRIDVYGTGEVVTCLACGESVDRDDQACAVNCARAVLVPPLPARAVSAGRQLA